MQEVEITTETITLVSFLKWGKVVASGGQAKILIDEGLVFVNGAAEMRHRRMLLPGDVVEVRAEPVRLLKVVAG